MKTLNQLTIPQRLAILCGSLFLITVVVGAMGRSNLTKVGQKYSSVLTQNMPKQRLVLEMFNHFTQVRIHLRTLGLSGLTPEQNIEAVHKAEEEIAAFEKTDKLFASNGYLPGEEQLHQNLETSWQEFKQVGQRIFHLNQAKSKDDHEQMFQTILFDCPRAAAKFKTAAEALVTFHLQVADSRSLEAQSAANRATRNSNFFIVFGLIAGAIFALISSKSITRALATLSDQLSNSRQGVRDTSDSLAATSQQLASSAQQQASSVEEVSSSLEEIAGMVASTVNTSENVSELVNSGSLAMKQLQSAVGQIAESNTQVEQLTKLIEDIGEKTELIDEIVFQTRLLSFNASVEAERAGEHGRGFAVVAQEVGNLAQMSGKSATEISQIVKNGIRTAHSVAQTNRSKVELGTQSCSEAAQKLEAIQKATQEILRASQEQNSGIQQINKSMQLISVSTQENASSAEACSENSRSLTEQVATLAKLIASLQEISTGKKAVVSFQGPAASRSQIASANPPVRQQVNPPRAPGAPAQVVAIRSPVRKPERTVTQVNKLPTGVKSVQGNTALAADEKAWEKL